MLPKVIDKLQTINSLDELLIEMMKYGKPRVSCCGANEWHSSIDMWVTGAGVEFSVKSDFKHKTPLEATIVCAKRMSEALNSLK
jgi:hypothetical protein